MVGELLEHVIRAVGGGVSAGRHTHRHRDGLLDLAVTRDRHLVSRVVDRGHQLLRDGEARLGAAGVDVDDGARGPEVLRPPAHLAVAGPVEPAGHRRNRRDVDRLLGHRPVGDGPLEVDVDRLGGADLGAVRRVEGRRCEDRLPDVWRRVLAGGRALRDDWAPRAAVANGGGARHPGGAADAAGVGGPGPNGSAAVAAARTDPPAVRARRRIDGRGGGGGRSG